MNRDPKSIRDDFLKVAMLAGIDMQPNSICVECLRAGRHEPPDLPRGKVAVYVFSTCECVLKVGKAGPRSQARYKHQHYNPDSTKSNLAKSIREDETRWREHNLNNKDVGEWIKANTNRVNFILDAAYYGPTLNLLEAFVQCRLEPIYEGR